MLRILILANTFKSLLIKGPTYPTRASGYGKVLYNLVRYWAEQYRIAVQPYEPNTETDHKISFPTIHGKRGDIHWYESAMTQWGDDQQLLSNYMLWNADCLLTLKEVQSYNELYKMPVEWVPWTPIDHSPVSPAITERLISAFKVVTMSPFGQKELLKNGISSTMIPHGYDPQIYGPPEASNPNMTREKLRPNVWPEIPTDAFVILYIKRNQLRCNPARAIMVANRFAEDNPDIKTRLVLWTDFTAGETRGAVPIRPILAAHPNLQTYWPPEKLVLHGIPEVLMPALYAAADVTFSVNHEGFGMYILESQATGTPCVIADYAAGPDILFSGYKIKVKDYDWNNSLGIRVPLADIDDGARCLAKIANGNPEKLKRRALRGVKPYTWEKINEKWTKFWEECEPELCPMIEKGKISRWDIPRAEISGEMKVAT